MQEAAKNPYARRRTRGFTLVEFMVALALAAMVLGLAVPNMRLFIKNNRLSTASNDLLRSFNLARSSALLNQKDVVVCASSDPAATTPVCSYGAFKGWIVFVDANANWQADGTEKILERHELLDASIIVKTDNDGIESYNVNGFANPTAAKSPTRTILICDDRGTAEVGNNSVARAVLIANTGRARVTRDVDEIKTVTDAGLTCL
jgi:type IV fimbrial biogenesis protein FimT